MVAGHEEHKDPVEVWPGCRQLLLQGLVTCLLCTHGHTNMLSLIYTWRICLSYNSDFSINMHSSVCVITDMDCFDAVCLPGLTNDQSYVPSGSRRLGTAAPGRRLLTAVAFVLLPPMLYRMISRPSPYSESNSKSAILSRCTSVRHKRRR